MSQHSALWLERARKNINTNVLEQLWSFGIVVTFLELLETKPCLIKVIKTVQNIIKHDLPLVIVFSISPFKIIFVYKLWYLTHILMTGCYSKPQNVNPFKYIGDLMAFFLKKKTSLNRHFFLGIFPQKTWKLLHVSEKATVYHPQKQK